MPHFASIDFEDWYRDVEGVPGERRAAFERQHRIVLDCLEEAGVRCTFFVLGATAERHPALVRELSARGHEVASHGYGHERVDRLTPARFAEDVERSVAVLEAITGERPIGYRAPYFSVTRREFWMYDVLAERGFAYSSSVFPFGGRKYGIADFPLSEQIMPTRCGAEIIEYPLAVLDVLGGRLPIAGGGFWRLLPEAVILQGIREIQRRGRPFTMYLHLHEFDPEPLASHRGPLRNFYVNLGRSSIKRKFMGALRELEFQPFRGAGRLP